MGTVAGQKLFAHTNILMTQHIIHYDILAFSIFQFYGTVVGLGIYIKILWLC